MKLFKITFIILIALLLIFVASAGKISNMISSTYGIKYNDKRKELGLVPLNSNWQLDTIEVDKLGKYDDDVNHFKLLLTKIKDNKVSTQYWKNQNIDTTKTYHKLKWISHFQSSLFWKNRIISELDQFIKPLNNKKYVSLVISYGYEENEWFIYEDTVNIELDNVIIDENDSYICADDSITSFVSEVSVPFEKVEEILNAWKTK